MTFLIAISAIEPLIDVIQHSSIFPP